MVSLAAMIRKYSGSCQDGGRSQSDNWEPVKTNPCRHFLARRGPNSLTDARHRDGRRGADGSQV